jgi:hypothetical protein
VTRRLRRLAPARPAASLLLVSALLAVGSAVAVATAPARTTGSAVERGPARQVSVARAAASCPDPVVDEGTTSRVALAGPGPVRPTGRDTPRPGQATLSTAGGSVLARLQVPGSAAVDAPAGSGPLVARATEGSAPGLAAAQLTRSTEATMRGLSGTACAPAGTDFWFVGSGAVIGQRGRVYLTNPEPAPAVVDITLYGPDGPIDAPDGRGVSVAGGAQEIRLLDALAPDTTRFAVHVRARQGRVSAAVRDHQVEGLTPLGADWVPTARAPAGRVLVPGVPGGEGERLLQVVAPGGSDAIVRIRLLADSGAFAPAGLDLLEVRAGTVAEVDLAPHAGGETVSVEVVSDVPVTAGVLARVRAAPPLLGEIAYAAATAPLTPDTPGAVPEVRQVAGRTNQLLLTAPGREVTAEVTPLPPAAGDPTVVTVPAGSQVALDLSTVSGTTEFAVTVAPRSGRLLAVHQVDEAESRGAIVTSSPVPPGRYRVPVPRVVADLSTGLRGGG